MRRPVTVLLLSALVLSSCGWRDSRVNPTNWFGKSRDRAPVQASESATNPLIPRARRGIFQRPEKVDVSVPIAEITDLTIERTLSGAIIHATGIAARQGAYDTELRLDPDSPDGVISYTFVVNYPSDPTPVGTPFSRTIHEAVTLSEQDMAGIRVIRVAGAGNARESRRR